MAVSLMFQELRKTTDTFLVFPTTTIAEFGISGSGVAAAEDLRTLLRPVELTKWA
jgi:hypothetical protein